MSDFGTLSALRTYFLASEKVGSNVHLTLPPMPKYPAIIISLEEITLAQGTVQGKVVVKLRTLVKELTPKKSLELADILKSLCEGYSLKLPYSCQGIIRVRDIQPGKCEMGFSSIETTIEILVRRES